MRVSIVIPNYNGKKYLDECLTAICRQSFTSYEVIFIDNGSTDGSLEYIKEKFPWVNAVVLDGNYGFSKAVNKGIELSTGEFVVLLNTDTSAEPQWLEELVKCISSDKRIFSCSSKMIQYNSRSLIDDAGDEYMVIGWPYQVGHGRTATHYNKEKTVFSACAGAGIYRKKILQEIGAFDESFFAYLEDMDLGYRAAIEGYKNVYCPDAVIYHIGSASSGGGLNTFKVKLSARNNVFMIYKNMPLFFLAINLPFLLIGLLMRLITFNKDLRQAYWAGFKEGVRLFHKIKKTSYKLNNNYNYLKIEIRMILKTATYFWNKTWHLIFSKE